LFFFVGLVTVNAVIEFGWLGCFGISLVFQGFFEFVEAFKEIGNVHKRRITISSNEEKSNTGKLTDTNNTIP
jgi:hypothetical protein